MARPLLRISAIAMTVALGATLVLAAPAQALGRDTDHDGMPDRWERKHNLNWKKPNARGDADHDGITNLREFRLGLNPRHADPQCTDLQKALGATDPSQCGSASITMFLG